MPITPNDDQQLNDPVQTSKELSWKLAFWQEATRTAKERGSDAEAIQCQQVVQDVEQAILALRAIYTI